jgi:hypothetical protein
MPQKFKIKSKEEVLVELAGLYVEREGALVLDVDGAVEICTYHFIPVL